MAINRRIQMTSPKAVSNLGGMQSAYPQKGGMTRVSPGVYRDASGRLVQSASGVSTPQVAKGTMRTPQPGSQIASVFGKGGMSNLPGQMPGFSLTPEMLAKLRASFGA